MGSNPSASTTFVRTLEEGLREQPLALFTERKMFSFVCGTCGVSFQSIHRAMQYCSRRCANEAHKWIPRKKRQPTGKCHDCGTPVRIRKKRCVECRTKYKAEYKERRSKRNSQKVIEWRRQLKIKAVEYKGGKCFRCGYDKSLRALQFHHRDPKEKDFAISRPNPRSWDKVKVELDKCDLLCANCHSEIHDELYAGGDSSN